MHEVWNEWLSVHWFYPETLQGFEWYYPVFLYLLAGIPLIFLLRYLIARKFRQYLDIALPEKQARKSTSAWLRFVPPTVAAMAVACLLIALARPQKTNEMVERFTEGIDIVLALDISESMQIEDFTPNRLEAAKTVALEFIQGREFDRIGMVIFSGEAVSYAPLTTDYSMLRELVSDINFRMISKGGTAIGMALGVSINRLKDSEAKTKVIILLSDGENNSGNIDPVTAANLAVDFGIRIHTIAVGKEGRVPYGTDMFGRKRYIDQSLDETTLRRIAEIGKGEFFRATDNATLENVFDIIDEYEKVEIKENRYRDTKDFYFAYLFFGILLLLLWFFLKLTFLANAMED
jgi:Ca-activated chloride channel family protein